MKTSRYTEFQIVAILRQAEGGVPVAELCREHGMSNASFYKWRTKYGGTDAPMVSQMKAMEEENRRLRRMYAELSMQNGLLNCEGERHCVQALCHSFCNARRDRSGQHDPQRSVDARTLPVCSVCGPGRFNKWNRFASSIH
jgi:putative transposase